MATTKQKKIEAPKPPPFTFRKVIIGKSTPRFVSACPKCNH